MILIHNSFTGKVKKEHQTPQFDEEATAVSTLQQRVYLLEKAFGILDIFDEYILAAPKIRA